MLSCVLTVSLMRHEPLIRCSFQTMASCSMVAAEASRLDRAALKETSWAVG